MPSVLRTFPLQPGDIGLLLFSDESPVDSGLQQPRVFVCVRVV